MNTTGFIKMHGLGNDFVVLDGRKDALGLNAALVARIADRRTGVGCDQLIVVEPSAEADAFMRIYNADGSEVSACGNATRCIGELLMAEHNAPQVQIRTKAGLLECYDAGDGLVTVDMGPARLEWQEIPLAEQVNTLAVSLAVGPLQNPVAVSMGNPHAVFFRDDVESFDLAQYGPQVEHHPLFPERTNVEIAQVIDRETIRLRVWERGAGETLACGTGACATLVAAHRRGLTERTAKIMLPGGDLSIEWRANGNVWMTGPVVTSFSGTLDLAAFA